MDKNRLYTILLLVCIFLLSTTGFYELFHLNSIVNYIFNISLRVAFLVFLIIYMKKEHLIGPRFKPFCLKDFLILPFFLICGSNFISVIVNKDFAYVDVNYIEILKAFILYALVAIAEELVFRSIILSEFSKTYGPLKSIILSALFFGAIHIVNISSFASIPSVLVQMLYSFGLGLLLALVYVGTSNFIYPLFLHFLFDFINDGLVTNFFSITWNVWFYVVNASIALLAGLYGLFYYKKEVFLNVTEYLDN